MRFSDLKQKEISFIEDAIKNQLMRLGVGIDVVVGIAPKPRKNGGELIRVFTSDFQTTPSIYRSVSVMGEGYIEPLEEDVWTLNLNLSWKFEYYNKASNGVNIGCSKFRFFKESDDSYSVTNLGLTIY